ncbi:hypothetical protein TD95_004687 [Thielaviopsis punctulata]|uniref:AAA+ ATPase domain-containing protein n=1 Tax=Thielaviopsis punctulata TaxID=72032 RepID=A0A0F4ZDT8_9PEZI|nr:hypothetical protein TD95_004687 [Thielaviopsis punctulata]
MSQLMRLRPLRCSYSSSVPAITDPLVKYQSMISTGALLADQTQYRLAIHLRSVYRRLKDYVPAHEYQSRLEEIARLTAQPNEPLKDESDQLAIRNHPIWRNPLFKSLMQSSHAQDKALVRLLTSHEQAVQIDSPRGLFVSGEVGTGKSMMLDLLADGLPTSRKRRWHFNTFMLYIFSQLEAYRKTTFAMPTAEQSHTYSLLWMAQKLVKESPILFLDEFQMPDRAASKILNHLMIAFFQLGGVLVASSNRMPEELQRASGIDYAPAPFRDLVTKFLSFGMKQQKSNLFGGTSDFSAFVEVLKARCDFWTMDGLQDYRRRGTTGTARLATAVNVSGIASSGTDVVGSTIDLSEDRKEILDSQPLPQHYFLEDDDVNLVSRAFPDDYDIVWESEILHVYGRAVTVPRTYKETACFDFEELTSSMGPADYITLASTYHTFVIDHIPALTTAQKNEARRFITFLDALYEAGCRLFVRAQLGPDQLFFPDAVSEAPADPVAEDSEDATYSETIAEVYQDQSAPFRPNVSYYDTPSATSQYDPDQDAGRQPGTDTIVDYTKAGAFTGEDERFAYKRAASRLWELCGSLWHARTGQWWKPLPAEARHWEQSQPSQKPRVDDARHAGSQSTEITRGAKLPVEEHAGLSRFAGERVAFLGRKK